MRPIRLDIARLARDIAESVGDLLRLERLRSRDSKVYRDRRFADWLATEARAVVESGLEADQWSAEEVRDLAERMRGAALASRCGVRQVSGAPVCVELPEAERGTKGYVGASQRGAAPWVQLATAAGIGRELWDEDCDSWVNVPDDLAPGNYVALNVRGDSMLPLLHDGDTVLMALGMKPRNGTIVVARNDDGYVVKRLSRITTRGVYLESLNPDYDPVVIKDVPQPIAGCVVLRWCPHDRVV
jgi:hypothetical protein